jgi:hypothetical protein
VYLRDIARRLYEIMDRLAPKYRVAYALNVIDERPLSEVAAMTLDEPKVLHTPPSTGRADGHCPGLSGGPSGGFNHCPLSQ